MKDYTIADIEVGLEHSFQSTITREKMEKFLSISGDCNPLHTDQSFAKKQGFDDIVAYGMLTSSFYSTLVGVYIPGKHCLLHGIEVKFTKPVYINDLLTVSGKVVYINDAYKQLEIKADITNQDNIKVSKATIKVGVSDG